MENKNMEHLNCCGKKLAKYDKLIKYNNCKLLNILFSKCECDEYSSHSNKAQDSFSPNKSGLFVNSRFT